MDFGLALPTAGRFASAEAIGQVAEGAERIGLDSVWVFERLLSPTEPVTIGGGTMSMPEVYNNVYSPLEVLAFAAAKTSRVRLGTSVLIALFHNPAALGRSFATLDRLSGGRVVAGLGQGWLDAEFQAAGVPTSRKGAGFGEFIEALRAVWGPDPVSFDGRFYTIAKSAIAPKPVQDGGPPIIVGAGAPAALRRAAELGVGLNPVAMSWDALEGAIAAFRGFERDAGREPGALPVVVRVNAPISGEPLDERGPLSGSVQQVAGDVERLRGLGVNEVFWSMDSTGTEPDVQLARMTELLAAVR
ncbi:TIGR03619 family F420-dependent LLM class oxidoreductase [Spongiactinospora sp. TRM90649]|uniref:TIGR03619 family F420-dependent LLM class oxidoreductase n=1 Tax=Spongiactinospora sp. TRM90649 TaxID=3031114 RepID=UPI0023F7AA6C|nr:TIGR03619 family F420-dependent LLM class oxidoreductase [Spongiactinospora sp. TRM90649]MDF5751615.1 TIGR03619 family F420-dependent LLM class oxidoreductase [Spongiactinospora sp. TRM90649]